MLVTHHDPESQREDLLRLLSLVEDPRAMAGELKQSERGWLRKAESRLRLDERVRRHREMTRRAAQTVRLLIS